MTLDNDQKSGKEVPLGVGNVLDIEPVRELDKNECCLLF